MIKLIIFDYDGVIIDSFPNVYDIYKIICKEFRKPCSKSLDEFRKVYGDSSSECASNLGFSEEEKAKSHIIFRKEILKKEPKPFKKIVGVIKKLHENYKLVVVSSSYKEEIEQKLRKIGVLSFFDFIVAKEKTGNGFEKTKPLRRIIKNMLIKPDKVLFIGDRNVDFIEGAKAGLKNILLVDSGWGYESKRIPDYKPKAIVKKPEDILEAVKKF